MKLLHLTLALGLATVTAVHARANDRAYYEQFLYTESENADGVVSTRFLGAWQFDVGMSDMGHVNGMADLFLMPDGKFILKWSEMTDRFFPIAFHERFEGTWDVPGDQLVVGDIALGSRTVLNGKNAVRLTFLRDLFTPGLKGKTADLDYVYSNMKPSDP